MVDTYDLFERVRYYIGDESLVSEFWNKIPNDELDEILWDIVREWDIPVADDCEE